MKSNFNYTDRKRILQSQVKIILTTPDDADPSFDAELDLSENNFDPQARIVIEAYRRLTQMRFDWGSVEAPKPSENRDLTEVPTGPLFRVKVIAADGSGRILGLANGLRPEVTIGSGRVKSILPVEYNKNMGDSLWHVEYDEESKSSPVLHLNSKLHSVYKQPQELGAMILPAAFREILIYLATVAKPVVDDEDGPWADWMHFIEKFEVTPYSSDFDQVDARDWAEELVAAFCHKWESCMNLNNFWEGSQG